jgi:hypothetical protein
MSKITVHESNFPNLVSFPQGIPTITKATTVQISQKNSKGKKIKRKITSEFDDITYSATEFDGDGSKSEYCKYAIGVVDEVSRTCDVYPVNHIYLMRPVYQERVSGALKNTASMSSYERRKSLTEEFGTKVKKKRLHDTESNIITDDTILGKNALESVVEDIANDVAANQDMDIHVTAADKALHENRLKMLPLFDPKANSVDKAYPLHGLIPDYIMKKLRELHDELLSNDLNVSSIEDCDDFDAPVSRESYFQVLRKYFRKSTGDMLQIELIALLHALPISLGDELKPKQMKKIRDQLCVVLYLHFVIKFANILLTKSALKVVRSILDSSFQDCPEVIYDYLIDNYTKKGKDGKQGSVVMSNKLLAQKLKLYCVILTLTATGYAIDLTIIAKDMMTSSESLSEIAREVGCNITRRSVDSKASKSKMSTYAELVVPLKFPGPPKAGKKKR